MGWPDAKIRKATALIAVFLWVAMVVLWLLGWRGRFPMSGWYLTFMAAVVLVGIWRAFKGSHSNG